MAKPEWGTKRQCQSCGAKYYDFKRSPIVCPACGTAFDPEAILKARRARPAPAPKKEVPAKVEGEELEEELEPDVEEAAVEEEAADEEVEATADDETEKDAEEEADELAEDEDDLIEDTSELGADEDVEDLVEEEEPER